MSRFRSVAIPVMVAMGALLITSTVAMAQQEYAEALATPALATITAALAINNTADLNFGAVVPNATTPGTVALPASATPTRVGTGLTLGYAGNVTAARFTVTGEADATYAITLPGNSDVTLTHASDDPMPVTDFISNPTVAAGGLLTAGTQTLYVGATLNVGAAQPVGVYTGDFDVTVTYN